MRALTKRAGRVRFAGIGGPAMQAQGLASLLPLSDISVMGIMPVLRRLPQLLATIRKVADAAVAAEADILVIIDSPDFTHRVARRVRRAHPDLPDRRLREPERLGVATGSRAADALLCRPRAGAAAVRAAAQARLGGPDCTYVGHPLVDDIAVLQPNAEEQRIRDVSPATLIVMPGSREAEIRRLMPVFGAGIARLREPIEIVLPTLPALESLMRAEAGKWRLQPRMS